MNRLQKLSSFWIKIIAIILMTIQHFVIIYCSSPYYFGSVYTVISDIGLRIGTIAFPLFAFMIVEGVFHTSCKWKYIIRLGISALLLDIICSIIEINYSYYNLANIFTDLTLGAAIISCLELPKFKKLYVLIPLTIFGILLAHNYTNFLYLYSLKIQYGAYGILIILGFYLARKLFYIYSKQKCLQYQIDYDGYLLTDDAKMWSNLFACFSLIIINLCCWVMYLVYPSASYCNWNYQLYSSAACLVIFFYSQARGYNAKWFQYGCYVYYPLHLLILFLCSLI